MTVCQPWPPDLSCLPAGWNSDPNAWTANQTNSFKIAQKILTRLTAGRIGLCTIKLRPCRKHCAERYGFPITNMGVGFVPMLIGGNVYNITCGCAGPCGCGPVCEVALPGPVFAITEVKIDGTVVPANQYFVQDKRMLIRRGGTGCWPDCQALDQPDTQPGTWSVTYQRGSWSAETAIAASRYVTILAGELAAACENRACRLPSRVTNVVRDGVSYTLLDDPVELFNAGRTGLPEVDLWIASINPFSAKTGLRVWSPDLPQHRADTWPTT